MSDLNQEQVLLEVIDDTEAWREALDGKTPAEAWGITIEGKNKWLTLMQNASDKRV